MQFNTSSLLELAVLLLSSSGQLIRQTSSIKETSTVDSSVPRESTVVESVVGDELESGTVSPKPESPKPGKRAKKPKVKLKHLVSE